MPEINYKDLDAYLQQLKKTPGAERPQVYLFFGEELLYKKAFDALVESLMAPEERMTNCEPVDGAPEHIRDAVHRANTYAMLSGNKVVAVQESRIFFENQEKGKLIDKAKEAFQREDTGKAAKYILSLLGQLRLSLEDMADKDTLPNLLSDEGMASDTGWLLEIIDYCRENGLSAASDNRPDQFLESAISKGFPRGNYLVLTTDLVDKRRTLFKCFKEKGLAVDCSVPKGDRRADRVIQEEVLRNRTKAILEGRHKSIDPQAFARLHDMTGFDLRTFSNNLEKLVLYSGERSTITAEDVTAVLERSKQDPIYELTGAISDRNPVQSLKLIDSVLQAGLHHLQVFTAIVNQMRKLIMAKYFIQSSYGRSWQPGMPYNIFTAQVLPEMTRYDQELVTLLSRWDDMLTPDDTNTGAGEGKGKSRKKKQPKQKVAPDLLVAATPNNPYPIYLTLKKADNFSITELTDIYSRLGDTDMKLKRSARNPKLALEEIIFKICRK